MIKCHGSHLTVAGVADVVAGVAEAVLPYVLRYNAFILERHGTVCVGASLEEACARLEVVEHTAHITAVALAAGGAEPIDPAEYGHERREELIREVRGRIERRLPTEFQS